MEFGFSVLTAQFMIVVWVKAPNELFECWYKEIVVKDIQIYTGTIHIIHVHDHFIIFFLDLCARNSVASNIGWCLNLLLLGHIAWQKIVWNVIWPPSTQRIVKISYLNMKVSFKIQDSSTLKYYFCVSKFLHLSEVAKFNSFWKFTSRPSIKIPKLSTTLLWRCLKFSPANIISLNHLILTLITNSKIKLQQKLTPLG